MNSKMDLQLDEAIRAIRADEPDGAAVQSAARTAALRLGLSASCAELPTMIWACSDMQKLMPAYRNGTLPAAKASLVEAHLQECGSCLRASRNDAAGARVDWSAPRQWTARPQLAPRYRAWAVAGACALLITLFVAYKAFWAVPPGVRAEVTSIDGPAYVVDGGAEHALLIGAKLQEGDHIRTSGTGHLLLRLFDGSVVEVGRRTAMQIGARGRNTTVSLDGGAVIVDSSHRTAGHLYVHTPDCRVTEQGTVFSVNSGIKGSRVAVLQGTVQVAYAGTTSLLHPGDQVATSLSLAPAPLEQQIAWSPDKVRYLELLAQFSTLRQKVAQISFPEPRYASDIFPHVPSGTVLYVSIPNLGDFLQEANSVFHDQLNQSPELQRWWSQGDQGKKEDLDSLIGKLHSVSQYLGNEVVVVGRPGNHNPDLAVVAAVERSGLRELLQHEFAAAGLEVLTPESLAVATPGASAHEFALVSDHQVILTASLDALRKWNADLSATQNGFGASDFGKQIAEAYTRGAGIILAADLHQMIAESAARRGLSRDNALEQSGMKGVQFLIAEHREQNGTERNHLNLSFSGERQRVASWLAAPAPMGSLEFVSANAGVAIGALSKDPRQIADDIFSMLSSRGAGPQMEKAKQQLPIDLKEDFAATLGGEFMLALDGPVLPTPSWKIVAEVTDSARLENTLERLAAFSVQQSREGKGNSFAIVPEDVSGQRYYTINLLPAGTALSHYTFANGYLVAAPSRALVMEALQVRSSGSSLARSASFRATLPRDENENYSAIAYQNLSPILAPLLSQLSGSAAEAIRKLAADAHPTAACAWGEANRIEVASDSHLFGFDFLTLGALLRSGNKPAGVNVPVI